MLDNFFYVIGFILVLLLILYYLDCICFGFVYSCLFEDVVGDKGMMKVSIVIESENIKV